MECKEEIKAYSNEKELVSLLKTGNRWAFERLYHRYKYRLAGNLMKLLKSEELTEEILQDLFLRIWDSRNSLDPEKSFRSYLFRIAENMTCDLFRKAARDKKLREQMVARTPSGYSHIEEGIAHRESRALLEQILETLPPMRRQVYTLCKLEGKTYEEVSRMLGISVHTISNHMTKASRTVRTCFCLSESMTGVLAMAFSSAFLIR